MKDYKWLKLALDKRRSKYYGRVQGFMRRPNSFSDYPIIQLR